MPRPLALFFLFALVGCATQQPLQTAHHCPLTPMTEINISGSPSPQDALETAAHSTRHAGYDRFSIVRQEADGESRTLLIRMLSQEDHYETAPVIFVSDVIGLPEDPSL